MIIMTNFDMRFENQTQVMQLEITILVTGIFLNIMMKPHKQEFKSKISLDRLLIDMPMALIYNVGLMLAYAVR